MCGNQCAGHATVYRKRTNVVMHAANGLIGRQNPIRTAVVAAQGRQPSGPAIVQRTRQTGVSVAL